MINPISPCLDCNDRVYGCWGDCERYQEWIGGNRAIRQKIYDARRKQGLLDSYFAKSVTATKARVNKKK